MATPKYQQRCGLCKKNMVMMFSRKQFPICTDCQMKQIDQPIEDPEYKKFFDIPEKFYKESYFLRNIKSSYIRFGSITENQRDAFLKTVVDMKKGKKETKE
ncbi:hypothetical protein HYX11_02380 [Candidatus Woesearchaeota archaeon]|nr:hypothetical protein [Candidatus Woesearchaeota archaeon]